MSNKLYHKKKIKKRKKQSYSQIVKKLLITMENYKLITVEKEKNKENKNKLVITNKVINKNKNSNKKA